MLLETYIYIASVVNTLGPQDDEQQFGTIKQQTIN